MKQPMRMNFDFRFSIFISRAGRWLASGIAAALAIAMPVAARAQGCVMCYTSASAAKKAGMEALQNGVMILLFPPLLMFAVILWHTFHRRDPREALEPGSSLPRGLTSQPLELESTIEHKELAGGAFTKTSDSHRIEDIESRPPTESSLWR